MTPTRKRLPRAEREQRMLDAAEKVFASDSFQAASMEEIAKHSGITKAMLYQYFGSKEGLYEATIERGRADLFEKLAAAVASAEPGRPRLVAFLNGYFDYVEANRGSWWLLYGETSSGAVNAMRARNADLIAELLRESLAELDHEADPDLVAILARSLVGSGEEVGRWWASRPDVPKARVVEQYLAVASGAIDATFRPIVAPAVQP
jgi:AcrR family transcriptional regulator